MLAKWVKNDSTYLQKIKKKIDSCGFNLTWELPEISTKLCLSMRLQVAQVGEE